MLIEKFACQFDALIILEFIVFSIGVMLLSRRLFRPIIKCKLNMNLTPVLSRLNDTMRGAFLVIIAFAISGSYSNYRNMTTIVGTEALQINKLDQLLIENKINNTPSIRQNLSIYVQSIINDEWPELYLGHRNQKTQKIWENFSKQISNINPSNAQISVYQDIIKLTSSINESRESRIASASLKIPGIFWVSILILFVARFLLFTCYDDTKEEAFGMSFDVGLLAALIGVIFILDSSYARTTRIGPQSFQETIQLINSRS